MEKRNYKGTKARDFHFFRISAALHKKSGTTCFSSVESQFRANGTATERSLCEVWCRLLARIWDSTLL